MQMTYSADISPSQLKKLSRIVYEESGIVIGEKKLALLRARIAKRIRVTKTKTISEYIELIAQSHEEFLDFIDAITTNHTFFFRENRHCEFIVKNIDSSLPLKIWCAASSSGEEPYSIAVQLLSANFKFSIFASDISDSMLKIARRGIYPQERLKQFPHPSLSRYFQKGQRKWAHTIRVKPEVQRYVSFDKFNLISDSPTQQFDIIFCRNVMIYFDNKTRQRVVNNLLSALKPGGFFFVGMSESLNGIDHPLSHVIPSTYRKS